MSSVAFSASSSASARPPTIVWAVAITLVTTILGFGSFLLPGAEKIPGAVIVFAVVIGVVTVALCWWLWNCRRWAAIALTVIGILNMLSSLPGLIEPPSAALVAVIIAGIPLTLAPVWLMWHPTARKAYR